MTGHHPESRTWLRFCSGVVLLARQSRPRAQTRSFAIRHRQTETGLVAGSESFTLAATDPGGRSGARPGR